MQFEDLKDFKMHELSTRFLKYAFWGEQDIGVEEVRSPEMTFGVARILQGMVLGVRAGL